MSVKKDNDRILRQLRPALLWQLVGEAMLIPHGSGNEAALRDNLRQKARLAGHSTEIDTVGNLLVHVPATPGCEQAPTAVLQAHLDMVCDQDTPAAGQPPHDFTRDPLRLRRDGDWLKATGTSAGFDNIIGAAGAMAVALSTNVIHGPLEILLTVDEEEGMTGALGLSPDWLTGKMLLNLDNEDFGEICLGGAGGARLETVLPMVWSLTDPNDVGLVLTVSGLLGGHSAVCISMNRANAAKILTEAALAIMASVGPAAKLCDLQVGDKLNIIPHEGMAWLAVPRAELGKAEAIVEALRLRIMARFPNETGFALTYDTEEARPRCLAPSVARRLIAMLQALPSEVIAMSTSMEGLVETSNNLARIRVSEDCVSVGTMPRSSDPAALRRLIDRQFAIVSSAGASSVEHDPYPRWKLNLGSPVAALIAAAHERLYGTKAKLTATHGGLECGPLAVKYPRLDIASFGPTIVSPHSTSEAVLIPTVASFWDLLCAVLGDISKLR